MAVLGRCVAAVAIIAALLAAVPATVGAQQDDLSDIESSAHKPAIDALNELDVFEGTLCGEDTFCPSDPVSRATMAVWLIRAIEDEEPPALEESRFDDVDAAVWWAPYVERVAELGITSGCRSEPPLYCPDRPVTRAQMATFLVRAFDLEPAGPAGFTDTSGSVHNSNIDALAAARITSGCKLDPLQYCPNRPVTRGQMATFLARALGVLEVPEEPQEPVVLPGEGATVIAARANWVQGYFQAELHKLLLEELGYEVSDPAHRELSPSIAYVAMAQGEIDYWPNSWYPAHRAWHEAELPDGTLVGDHLSIIGEQMLAGGAVGFLVNKSFADAYGVYTVDDLNRNAQALAAFDAADPVPGNGKADIYGCPESWLCEDIIENMIAFSGWDNIAQVSQTYDTMFNRAVASVNDGAPTVIYAWAPSTYITRLRPGNNVYWMGVENILDDSNPANLARGEDHSQRRADGTGGFAPIGADQCPSAADQQSGLCRIGWIAADILVTANRDFLAANPAAATLFEQVKLPVVDVSLATALVHGGDDPADVAAWWISDNRDLVDGWIAAAVAAGPGVLQPQDAYTDVAAGAGHYCALRTDRTVECWGAYYDHVTGQHLEHAELPEGAFSSVSAGYNHMCGLRTDGTVTCWGANTHGQARPPFARVDFSAIDAGNHHSCGLGVDGSITCWGANGDGQAVSQAGGSFIAVDAGIWHTCGLRRGGTIRCWGSNHFGQIDAPTHGGFTDVAAGALHTCGLRANGTVTCWGTNNSGGYVGQTDAPGGTFTAISAGAWYTCGIRTGGSIECWGYLTDAAESAISRTNIPSGSNLHRRQRRLDRSTG